MSVDGSSPPLYPRDSPPCVLLGTLWKVRVVKEINAGIENVLKYLCKYCRQPDGSVKQGFFPLFFSS